MAASLMTLLRVSVPLWKALAASSVMKELLPNPGENRCGYPRATILALGAWARMAAHGRVGIGQGREDLSFGNGFGGFYPGLAVLYRAGKKAGFKHRQQATKPAAAAGFQLKGRRKVVQLCNMLLDNRG